VYNKLVQKAFSGHFAGSFFHSFIHSFSFEPSLMNKPSLPVHSPVHPLPCPQKEESPLLPACLPAYCSCACQLCFKVGTLIIQVLGLGSKPQFWFGACLVLDSMFWALTGGHVCVCDSAVSGFLSGSGFFFWGH
jgi:hypothetical protein